MTPFRFVSFMFLLLISNQTLGIGLPKSDSSNIVESTQTPTDKFSVSLGAFFAGYHSGIKVGSDQLGLGFTIDLEKALGLEVSTWAMRGKVNYRFGERNRHGLSIGFFSVTRNAIKIPTKEINIGDLVIPIGATIRSKYSYSIYRLKYEYAFFQDDRVSLGASFGFFVLPVKLEVEVDGHGDSFTSFIAPLPTLGVQTDFLITPKFFLRQSIEVLYLSFGGFTGALVDLDISVEFRPIRNLGFGLGFNKYNLDLSAKTGAYPGLDFFGEVSSTYSGLYLFAKFSL